MNLRTVLEMAELKKKLGLWDVFAISAGAMISSGLFVRPALAYAQCGPGLVLAYVLASVMVFPSVLSKAELSTAMQKAGGTYYSSNAAWAVSGACSAAWLVLPGHEKRVCRGGNDHAGGGGQI